MSYADAPTRGAMRVALAGRPVEEVWPAVFGWTVELGPFWLAAIDHFAAATALPAARHDRYRAAAGAAFERMDDWWHGRVKLVKARRAEIDSAISFIRNTALDGRVRDLPAAPVARHVASGLRACLHLAAGSYTREQLPSVTAGLVYTWAECRTLFPGDSAALLQHVPADQLDGFDQHQRLYGAPADRFGLRAEADAVCAEARRIWAGFDRPLRWDLPEGLWTPIVVTR
jgi:hypothetical protein